MLDALRRLRFRLHLWQSRFSEALAVAEGEGWCPPEERAWILHRLGCYRSVVSLGTEAGCGRAAIAVGASLAACGEPQRAESLLRHAATRGWLSGARRVAAVRAVAPFHVDLAAELVREVTGRPGLKAAVLRAAGHDAPARRLVDEAVAAGRAEREPDLFLLEANFATTPAARRAALNAHLGAHGLSPIATAADDVPPSPATVRATVAPATARGPLVTVIMPAFDTSARIGPAVASLLAQTWRDLEILVVDDASTDDTAAAAERAAAGDPRVRVLKLERNGGPYVARNHALAAASGEFVTCHDSDDWAHPERIARQIAPLLRFPRLVCTTSNWVRVTDDGTFYARPIYPLCRLNPASPLFRREPVLARLGGWEPVRAGADSEYLARLKLAFGPFTWRRVAKTLTLGAHRPGSLMTDPQTGMDNGAMNPERLAYWEKWSARHRRMSRAADRRRFALAASD